MSKFLNNMTVDGDLSVTGGISSGTVTAQQFSYLSGATSNIQQQITNLTNNTTGKLLSSKEDIVACTDPSYFASATAVKEINNNLAWIDGSSTGSHNSHYVSINITPYYQDGSLWDRIAGTNGYDAFEGIYPGCILDMSRPITAPATGGGTVEGTKRLMVLECNGKYNVGQPATGESSPNFPIRYNHIVLAPVGDFGKSCWNSTDTTEGGYYNSFINQQILGTPTTVGNIAGTINEQLYYEFGNHLKTYKERISTLIDTNIKNYRIPDKNIENGVSNSSKYHYVQSILLSEIELYGSIIFGSSAFDIGTSKKQFSAFQYNVHDMTTNYSWFWLRDIVTSKRAASHIIYGSADYSLTTAKLGVRPSFILA